MKFTSRLGTVFLMAMALVAYLNGAPLRADQTSDHRMQWWRDAKFGMFIHWGVYAVPAGIYEGKPVGGIGEWIMLRARIPVNTYKQFARQFNPTKYDPEAWAELARQAGMKYMVITSKHHDGFALFDSAVTDWDIADASPYGKDLLAPLAAAARNRGLKFGLYYSQAQDWNHPGGAKSGFEDHQGWDDAQKGSFDEYLAKIAVPQTREILKRYQPDVLWWDTPVLMTAERAKPLHDLLALQPMVITNNRLGGGYEGDTKTPEQHIPSTGLPGDWETCMTINDTWGYKSSDHNWKSTETLIDNLVDIVSKGGNYLLNVGPTAQGEIPAPCVERLRAVGKWMTVNGDAIYGTKASPCRAPIWGRITQKEGRLYLCVFDWAEDGGLSVPIKGDVTDCHLLVDSDRTFSVSSSDDGLNIELDGKAPDDVCSVIVLDVAGPVEEVTSRVKQQADGTLTLVATDSVLQGAEVRVEQIDGQPSLGYWTDAGDSVEWPCTLTAPSEFVVSAEVAGPESSQFTFQCGAAQLPAHVAATGDYHAFKTVELGHINVAEAGELTASIHPTADNWHAINLRRVVLRPVR